MQRFFHTLRGKPQTGDTGRTGGVLTWCAVSDVGCRRPNNEDNFLLDERLNADSAPKSREPLRQVSLEQRHLAGLFDGMGGGEAGELASMSAAEILRDTLPELRRAKKREQLDSLVRGAFLKANNAVLAYRSQYQIFGTTGTVLLIDGGSYKLYHLGDSRAYLYRNRELYQLTRDQTLAQLKIDTGLCEEDSAEAKAGRNQLTDFIGKDRTGESLCPVESAWSTAEPGDTLLLCSDGLYDMCTREQIHRLLGSGEDVLQCADALVEAALNHGGQDNVTCVLVRFL